MVSQRVLLQERLETFCTNVYFQPPSKLNYPCILYSTDDVDANYGNNKSYILHQRWRLTVIEKNHEDCGFEVYRKCSSCGEEFL